MNQAKGYKRNLLALRVVIVFTVMIAVSGSPSEAADLKKVRLGVPTTFLGIYYPWLMMPQALGYWKDEGYDVEVLPIGGSLQVVQQMVGGGIDIGEIASSVLIQSNATNGIPLRVFMTNGVVDWSVAVPSDSAIRTVADLKGKKIGVFNLASGGIPYLEEYLSKNGIDPENDVQLVPVGLGAAAVQALKSGRVDALMFWAAANAGFENAGLSLRYIADPEWRGLPDFVLAVLDKKIKQDPKMLEVIARGAAKAIEFSIANPDCVRRIQWATWPDTKPTGAGEETLSKWDLNTLNAELESLKAARQMNESKLWGQTDVEPYSRMQDFLKKAGLIKTTVPATDFVPEDQEFFKRINSFDHEAIAASAKACNFK